MIKIKQEIGNQDFHNSSPYVFWILFLIYIVARTATISKAIMPISIPITAPTDNPFDSSGSSSGSSGSSGSFMSFNYT